MTAFSGLNPIVCKPSHRIRMYGTNLVLYQTAGVYRTATKGESIANVEVAGGQPIFASIVDANTDVSTSAFVLCSLLY